MKTSALPHHHHHRHFRALASLLLALFLILGLAACKQEATVAAPPTPEVPVATPLDMATMDWDDYTGRIEAIEQVDIRSRVSGYINKIEFKEGSVVQKGDQLFVIDPRPYQAELARAEAELERAKAQEQLTKLEFDRAKTLTDQKVISVEEFDAKAASASQSSSNVRGAEAAVETARLNLDYCYIKAPVAGKVSLARITEGNLVQPGGEILTTIVSQDPMYVTIDADENAFLRYKEMCGGKDLKTKTITILMALSNEKGYPHQGRLDFFDNRVDPNTGTIRMRAIFENKSGYLTPGLFARVRVPGSLPYEGLLLPDSAINTDQSQKYVLVAGPEGKVEYRKVELGPLNGGLRVVKSGLSAEDQVVLQGFHAAQPGSTVKPRLEELRIDEEALQFFPKPAATARDTAPTPADGASAEPAPEQEAAPSRSELGATTGEGVQP